MELPVFTVDSFSSGPFSGNPAAVCLLHSELQDDLYQKIAAEMNLSETAFIRKLNPTDDFHSGARFGLRWFTPATEVPLCGHATLASAAVLFTVTKNSNQTLTFETLSGALRARLDGDYIVMDLPINEPIAQDPKEVKELIKAAVGELTVQDVLYCGSLKKIIVRLSDTYERHVLESLKVDPQSLMRCETTGKVKSLVVTLKGNPAGQPAYDFYSRNFAPWYGVPEDPVTGSSHTVLGSYWAEKLGKLKMLAFQCSPRGGELKVSLREDGRVDVAGRAVIVLQGNLRL
ncbi:phenazine biosynthesis-like domain-containing protein isoform X1 [Amia ocellicauda]|uniref:phenazine biosynthesis-like domain-containing protein isoform X1 n=1 Tax=Amia ocellicauda TaxID=2972642 RepID=UPI003463E6B8|nr:PBLD protein [Amia calva]